MVWFNEFVKNTINEWEKIIKKSGILERLMTLKKETEYSLQKIGKIGEEFIKEILEKKGYTATLSPGSRSPADVWGVKLKKEWVHIPLIQVKTTFSEEKPERLNEDDIQLFLEFAEFTHKAFYKDPIIPNEFKNENLIVSTGYAGVILKDNLIPELESAYYLDAVCLNKISIKYKKYLIKFHSLTK